MAGGDKLFPRRAGQRAPPRIQAQAFIFEQIGVGSAQLPPRLLWCLIASREGGVAGDPVHDTGRQVSVRLGQQRGLLTAVELVEPRQWRCSRHHSTLRRPRAPSGWRTGGRGGHPIPFVLRPARDVYQPRWRVSIAKLLCIHRLLRATHLPRSAFSTGEVDRRTCRLHFMNGCNDFHHYGQGPAPKHAVKQLGTHPPPPENVRSPDASMSISTVR